MQYNDEQLGDVHHELDALDPAACLPAPGEAADPPVPASLAATARQALALLGGVAGAGAIARLVEQRSGRRVGARAIRQALRHGGVRPLGAGFHALPQAVEPPVLPWLRSRLRRLGPRTVDALIADIMARWPHGDAAAIRAWLTQDHPGVSVCDGVLRLVEGGAGGDGGAPC